MSKEMMIVFVYDTECCKEESDDPVNAVLYFHPSWVSDIQKVSLCGQLMGTTHFLSETFGKPKIISLQSGKFVLKQFGRFILAVGTDRNLSNSVLEHRSELLISLLRFFHRDIQTMYEQFTSTSGQYKNLSDKLYHIFETYLPILQYNGNIFQNMPISRLPKSASNIFLEAMQTLQCCQQTKGILGGSIFFNNKVIATQLSPELTKNLVLTDPYRIRSTAESISVDFHIPIGVQLIIVYIPVKDYRKLSVDSQRAQSVMNPNVNPIIPFQFKKKIKRDKSLIFTNIPEEGIASDFSQSSTSSNSMAALKSSPAKMIQARPNHLPLRFKNITSKDIPESGFSSINFDESDSFPQFIGRTSVCSTPMTENKILHGAVLSICANPDEANNNGNVNNNNSSVLETAEEAAEDVAEETTNFSKNISQFINNPFRSEVRRNSLTDLQETIKKVSKRLTLRALGFGLSNSNKNVSKDTSPDDIEIDDFDRKIYRTITDPTYPVFNSDGAPISKCLFQEFLEQQFQQLNNSKNISNNNVNAFEIVEATNNLLIDDFDSEMKTSPVHKTKVESTETVVPAMTPNRIALSLPLKSLSLDVDSNDTAKDSHTATASGSNIFELPAHRKKLSGIQLTPLMSKLSILAMTDERSSGFSSWDTTPGVEMATPMDGSKVPAFRRRSSIKFDDVVDVATDEMQKCELFICGQQNMTMLLLMDENSSQKHEIVHSMFDTCVSRLTRIETNLSQTLNVNVDGDKNDGGYSFLSMDPNWDTLQRGGPWSAPDLTTLENVRNDFKTAKGITDIILRTDDSVVYGYQYGKSSIFYKQGGSKAQSGLPPPADTMGTIPLSAKCRLERDHSIILL